MMPNDQNLTPTEAPKEGELTGQLENNSLSTEAPKEGELTGDKQNWDKEKAEKTFQTKYQEEVEKRKEIEAELAQYLEDRNYAPPAQIPMPANNLGQNIDPDEPLTYGQMLNLLKAQESMIDYKLSAKEIEAQKRSVAASFNSELRDAIAIRERIIKDVPEDILRQAEIEAIKLFPIEFAPNGQPYIQPKQPSRHVLALQKEIKFLMADRANNSASFTAAEAAKANAAALASVSQPGTTPGGTGKVEKSDNDRMADDIYPDDPDIPK